MATKPMTKADLTDALAQQAGVDKKAATSVLDALSDVITKEVAEGGAVTIPGVGKVHAKQRPEREVRNPATGKTMTKGADLQVKVTIAKSLKDGVNA
ncbi:HU family DNA-binding protein [Salipiger mucosus]|uniref:DNA-binding protein HU n=1 Tax=Salipiger mucosus DSM 16094 TaxID=1123237 RepID=S9Q5W7_9RHOB|nr:HU family DNA-binding protein [Salipiger mucosus]EPX76776.1 DNA-binding protein HU [Salipiger mucosus DSM 16094]